jgi:L-phenylalanine/L-methionine N-acetyltransferase
MDPIQIRHSTLADAEAIHAIYAEPTSIAATLQLPFPPVELWKKRMESLEEGCYSLVACRGDDVLGQLGIEKRKNPRRAHAATIGMAVRSSARRQGVASALMSAAIDLAEKWLAVRRIELEVYTDNEEAIGVYRKFQFEVEGTMRQYAFRDGKLVDAYVMARVAA